MKMSKKMIAVISVAALMLLLSVSIGVAISGEVSATAPTDDDDIVITNTSSTLGVTKSSTEAHYSNITDFAVTGSSASATALTVTLKGTAGIEDGAYPLIGNKAIININMASLFPTTENLYVSLAQTNSSLVRVSSILPSQTLENGVLTSYYEATVLTANSFCIMVPMDGSDVTLVIKTATSTTAPTNIKTLEYNTTVATLTLKFSEFYTKVTLGMSDFTVADAAETPVTWYSYDYTSSTEKALAIALPAKITNVRFDGYLVSYSGTGTADEVMAAQGFAIKSRVSVDGTSDWTNWLYSTHISDLMGDSELSPWSGYWTTDHNYLTVVSISNDTDDRNWSAKVDAGTTASSTMYCTWDLNSTNYTASAFGGTVVENKSISLVKNCEYTIKNGTILSIVNRSLPDASNDIGYMIFQSYGKVTYSGLTINMSGVHVHESNAIAAITTKAGEGTVTIQSCNIIVGDGVKDFAVVASWYSDSRYTNAPIININNATSNSIEGNIAAGMYTTADPNYAGQLIPTVNLQSGNVTGRIVLGIFKEKGDTEYGGTNNYKVIVGENATVTGKLSVSEYGIVENNGTIIVNGASTIDGVLTNKGTINNSGTITVSDKGRIDVIGGTITKGESSSNGKMNLSIVNSYHSFALVVYGGVISYQDIELASTSTSNESPISLNYAGSTNGPVTFAYNNVTMKGSRAVLIGTTAVSATDNKLVSVNNNVFSQYGYDSTTADPAVKIEACIQIGESTNCEWSGVGLKISLTNNTFNIKTFDAEKDKPISVLSKATIGSDISNSDLVISNGSDVIFKGTEQITSDISLHDLWIKEGATVTVNSGKALTITGKLTNDATLTIAGTVNNGGTILNKVNRVIKIDGGTITKSGSTNGTFDIDSTAAGSVLLISGTIEYQNIDLVAGSVSQIWVSHALDGDGSRGNASIQNNSITLNGTYGILLQVMENKDKPSVLLSVNNNVFNAQGTNAAKWFVQVGSGEGQTIAEGISISIRNNSIADGSKAMDTSSPEYKPIKVLAKDRVKGSATENITVGTSDAILMISLDSSIGFRTSGVVSFVSDIILSDLGAYAGTTIVAKDACVRINGDAVVTKPLSTVDDGKYIVTPTSTYTVNSKKIVGAAADGYRLTLTSGIAEISTVNNDKSSIVLKGDGTVNVDYALESGDVFAVENGSVLTVDAGQTLEVKTGASLVNNGTIDVKGILTDNFIVTTSSEIIDNNGVINVKNGGQLKVGYYNPEAGTPGINIAGDINVYKGAKFLNNVGTENTLIGEGGQIVIDDGYVCIYASAVGGSVSYTLAEDSIATINQTYFGFKAGDSIFIYGILNADNMILADGADLYVGGIINVAPTKKLTVIGSAQIYVESEGALIGAGTVDFTAATSNSIVISAESDAVFTVTLDGSTGTGADKKYSAIVLDKIVAGADGFTISKGSVIINGYYTTDADGTITIPAKDELGNPNVAYISGNVDSDVTIKVAGEAKLEVATGSSLTFEAGSALVGKITVEKGSASEVIYEEGSVVNGAVIEVTTRETEEGVQVTVTITLRTENGDKLMLYYEGEYCEVVFLEAFEGDSFVDVLANVGVEPVKSRVSFDGWYNVLNEKVTSDMTVGAVAPTLTAKFTETQREGVTPHTPSIEPTVITVDETGGYDNTTMLVAAVAMLVVAIFVLGYVVIVKRK